MSTPSVLNEYFSHSSYKTNTSISHAYNTHTEDQVFWQTFMYRRRITTDQQLKQTYKMTTTVTQSFGTKHPTCIHGGPTKSLQRMLAMMLTCHFYVCYQIFTNTVMQTNLANYRGNVPWKLLFPKSVNFCHLFYTMQTVRLGPWSEAQWTREK